MFGANPKGGETASKQEATATALDSITNFQAIPGQTAFQERRARKYARRAEMVRREIRRARIEAGKDPDKSAKYGEEDWVKPSRRAFCGQPRYGGGAVSVKSKDHEDGTRAHFGGLTHCGSIWTCSVCSGIIRAHKAAEIREAARRHTANGGGLALVTFTIRHTLSDTLEDNMQVMADAFARMQGTRAYKDWRADFGMVGNIKATELPWGRHGWHVHKHVLYFFDNPIKHEDEAVLKADLFAMWSRAVEAVGGRSVSFDAFDVQAVEAGEDAVASYVTKVSEGMDGIACEVALSDVKAGRVEASLNPFQLLDVRTPEAERLWDEYVAATAGKSAIRWSRGLRKALGMDAEMTDEEIVEQAEAQGKAVMFIERSLYRERLANRPAALCAVLEAVEAGDTAKAGKMLGVVPYVIVVEGEAVPMFSPFGDGGGGVLLAVA